MREGMSCGHIAEEEDFVELLRRDAASKMIKAQLSRAWDPASNY